MQETFIDTRSCLDEEGLLHTFRYSLLTQHCPVGPFFLEEYGVLVEETGIERTTLFPITHSHSKIQALVTCLIDHVVTPTNLADIVEDWAKENRLPYQHSRR